MAVAPKKKKPKPKPKPAFRVYCTYFPNGTYYIGFSTKVGTQWDKYFGSSKDVLEMIKSNPTDHGLKKETIATYDKKSHAKAIEHFLQWKFRDDALCVNAMWNVRLRLDHLTGLDEPTWEPSSYNQLSFDF